MSTPEHHRCLIVGSGPAGYTAAIYAARADMKPVLYQGQQPGGQLTETTEVDNFPGYPAGINGPQMMKDLEDQAKRFDTDVRYGWVTKVDFSGPVHKVWVGDNQETEIHADTVIISTGASAKWLGLESELRLRDAGGGVSACAVCDGFFYRNQEVVIVGAGDSACDLCAGREGPGRRRRQKMAGSKGSSQSGLETSEGGASVAGSRGAPHASELGAAPPSHVEGGELVV